MKATELAKAYLPALLLGSAAVYAAILHPRIAPGFALMAAGWAIPFTRRQFNSRGSQAARLASTRLLLTGLGLVYLFASAAAPPSHGTFWLIAAVALAIFVPAWLWGVRLMAAAGREGDEVLRSRGES